MARVNAIQVLNSCPAIYDSIDDFYTSLGTPPASVRPLEFSQLYDLSAYLWRVKSWNLEISTDDGAITGVAEYDPLLNITSERDLVCTNLTAWEWFSGASTVRFGIGIPFIVDGVYYLGFSVQGLVNFETGDDNIVTFNTEYYSGTILSDIDSSISISIPTSQFSSEVSFSANFFTLKPDGSGATSGSLSITPNSFWPYADENGIPVYDSMSGVQINPD